MTVYTRWTTKCEPATLWTAAVDLGGMHLALPTLGDDHDVRGSEVTAARMVTGALCGLTWAPGPLVALRQAVPRSRTQPPNATAPVRPHGSRLGGCSSTRPCSCNWASRRRTVSTRVPAARANWSMVGTRYSLGRLRRGPSRCRRLLLVGQPREPFPPPC